MAEPVSASDVPQDHYDSSSSSDFNDWNSSDHKIPKKDELYNPNEDEEDEAFVYQHLRSGMEETVMIRRKGKPKDSNENEGRAGNHAKRTDGGRRNTQHDVTAATDKQAEQAKMLKPRNSDAILSCPCCFQIVCMDCQRHEQYSNQFRAMFVMNIGVSWDKLITPEGVSNNTHNQSTITPKRNVSYEDQARKVQKIVASKGASESAHIPILEDNGTSAGGNLHYSVHCNKCLTEVAALDMTDEIYHFFGCLVSS